MSQPIQQSGGKLFVGEDLDPLRERQIRSDDGRTPLVTLSQQIEQQLAAGVFERDETQFINQQKCDFLVTLCSAVNRRSSLASNKLCTRSAARGEKYAEAAPRGFDPERDRQHGLAGANRLVRMTSSAWSMYWQLESSSIFRLRYALERGPIDLFESFYVGKARPPRSKLRAVL